MSDPNVRYDLRTVKRYLENGRLDQAEYNGFIEKLADSSENITEPEVGGDEDGFEERLAGAAKARDGAPEDAAAAAVAPAPAPGTHARPVAPVAPPALGGAPVVPPLAPPVLGDAPAPPPPPLEVPIGGGSFGPPKVD